MSRKLSLGYSPCPNDTFIFYGLTHNKLNELPFSVEERLEDVETLNQLALSGSLDLTKISYHALGHLRDDYALLRSGGALGRGCGPLIVATKPTTMNKLRGKRFAIPGKLTTANLLLQLYDEGFDNLLILPFDQIMPALQNGQAEAGVIIHESRFTYQQLGFHEVQDLGAWWEENYDLPLPLGVILIRRDLGSDVAQIIEDATRRSLLFARQHQAEVWPYIKMHAQEMDDCVIRQHIDLYVNDYSLELGEEGRRAVSKLLELAHERGLVPPLPASLFLNE